LRRWRLAYRTRWPGKAARADFCRKFVVPAAKKLFIQVVTTQGNTLQAGLDVKPSSQPASISHHLNHCPFCHAGTADVALPSFNPAFALYLAAQEKAVRFDYAAPVQLHFVHTAHPTRAPPVLL
jgi:hypothetical protein